MGAHRGLERPGCAWHGCKGASYPQSHMRHTWLTCLATRLTRIRERAARPRAPQFCQQKNTQYSLSPVHSLPLNWHDEPSWDPLFDALLLCPGMMGAAPGCPSCGAVPQGRASWGCMRESLPWSSLMALASCTLDQVLYLRPCAPWPRGAAHDPGLLSGCCRPRSPAGKARAAPAAAAISQSLDFSSTDIAFPGVAITTGVKSLLTLPCCTNCTISCHCYMPVISLEGLKLLSATSPAPSLPPWA